MARCLLGLCLVFKREVPMFHHLIKLYACFYLARKKLTEAKNKEKGAIESFEFDAIQKAYEEAKTKYFNSLADFEVYLDAVGDDEYYENESVFTGYPICDSKNEDRIGWISEKIGDGWRIEWFNRQTLEPLGSENLKSLKGLKIIKHE